MTQVNWSRQLMLAATLFVLGTFAYWLEFKHKPDSESSVEQSKKVLSLKGTPVDTLRISGAGKAFELKCADASAKLCKPGDNSKWEITEPSKLKADDSNVANLVSAINNVSSTEVIDLKDETPEKRAALLKEYGLDPEARKSNDSRKVQVKTAQGMMTLYLGQTHPIGEGIFSLLEKGNLDETKVYLIPSYFKSNFEHDLTYWRDKKLFSVGTHEIEGFTLNGTKAHVTAERKDGQWTLRTRSEEFAGDIEGIDNALTAATYLSAKGYAAEDKKSPAAKKALKGTKPFLSLTLQKEKGSAKEMPAPFTLTLYQKVSPPRKKEKEPKFEGKLFATVSNLDPLYELDPFIRDRLDKDTKDLRLTKLITSMERFTAKRLEFSGKPIGSQSLVLLNKDGKWISETDKTEATGEKVQATLDKLSGNRIKEFLQGSQIPSGEQDGIQFTLGDEKSAAKRQIVFWKSADKLYGRDLQSKRKEAFLVDSAIQSELPWDRMFFFKKPETAAKAGK